MATRQGTPSAARLADPPPIAVVVTQLTYGGAERQTFELLRALKSHPWRPTMVVALSDQLDPYGARIQQLDYPLHVLGRRGSYDIRRLATLRALLKQSAIRLVHSVHLLASAYTWLAVKGLSNVAPVPSMRGSTADHGLMRRVLYGHMLRSAPVVLANSRRGGTFISGEFGVNTSRIAVVPNGVDYCSLRSGALKSQFRRVLGIPTSVPLIGFVGRNAPAKNVRRFLEVARIAMARHPTLHVVTAGLGLDAEALCSVARGLPEGRTHFLGPRNDIPSLLASLDALLLTSDSEGCPNVVLEALGVGTPVIASAVGDLADMIPPGAGMVVPPNRVAAYVSALDDILARPEVFRAAIADASAWLTDRFSVDAMAAATVRVWQRAYSSVAGQQPHA